MEDAPPAAGEAAAKGLAPRDTRAIVRANSILDTSPRQARVLLEGVVRRNPNAAAAWRAYTFGLDHHYEQSRCRAALARWEALAPGDPLIPAAHAGLAYSDLDFEEALRWIKRALDRDPENFPMLWAKAMSERFLRLPSQAASLAKVREADPARYKAEAERVRSLERFGSLELQNAFERILLIGTASDEGDIVRARRLLQQSRSEPVLPEAWADFRREMEKRLEAAERRTRGKPARARAPLWPARRRSRATAPAPKARE